MKKTIISSFCLMILVACSLDLKPESSWTDDTYFKNGNQLDAALYGGYVQLRNALGGGFLIYGSARSDEFYCYNTTKTDIDNIVNNGITPYNSYANWYYFYASIQQANLVLVHTPELLSEGIVGLDESNEVMGQAYCLRAYAYFWLTRVWGDCPLVLNPQTGDSYDARMKKTASATVINQIHDDLKKAQALLSDSGDRVHFTKSAAYAIETQLFAWEKKWAEALEASSQINTGLYSLCQFYNPLYTPTMTLQSDFYEYLTNSEFVKLFNEGNAKESIFELSYSIEDNSGSNTLYGLVGQSEALRPSMKATFETLRRNGDWRFFINFYGNSPRWTKYFVNFSGLIEATRNVVLLRYGEILLLKAEAYANLIEQESDNGRKEEMLDAAVTALNEIRYRAGGDALKFSVTDFDVHDMEAFRNIIMQERLIELYGEGYRYFDLIRFGKLLEVMQPVNGQNRWESAVWPIYYTEVLYSGGTVEQNTYYR